MTDRLDRTLTTFVDEGRMTADLAADITDAFHSHHGDVRQRLAELGAYAGAALAVLGLVVMGSQVWDDFSWVLRVAIPAILSAGLMTGTWLLRRSVVRLADAPVRSRLAQVLGVCSAIAGALAVGLAAADSDLASDWPFRVAVGAGLVLALMSSALAPGAITTLATGAFAVLFGFSCCMLIDDGPAYPGVFLVVLGMLAALLLHKVFPPPGLTRALGVAGWLFGAFMLLISPQEYEYRQMPYEHWVWLGRLAAAGLIVVGVWLFARGGSVVWAIGAALAAAALVGLWTAEALNAGIALLVAGLVLIAIGGALGLWRRSAGKTPPSGAKMEP